MIQLDLDPDHFTDVLSLRASKPEHSGSLELKGVRLGLRWALRKVGRFHHRLLFLVDARASIAAVAKGRSGAASFKRTLSSIGALQLATNTMMRCLYIPSEDNPADAPSRGRPRRRRKTVKVQRFDKRARRLHTAVRELEKRNAFMEDNSDFDSFSGSEGGRCEDHAL